MISSALHWNAKKLGDLATEVTGSVQPRSDKMYELYSVPAFASGKPEVVAGNDIRSSKRPITPGDILLCRINPRINRVWMVSKPTGSFEQLASTEYLVLRTPDQLLAQYLVWYLRSPRFREWIKLAAEGATGSHTRAKNGPIMRQLVPIPPSDEQRRIIKVIEEQFSSLHAAEGSLGVVETKLQAFRRQCFQLVNQTSASARPITEVARIVSGQTPKALVADVDGRVPFFKVGDMNKASGYVMDGARTYLNAEAARKPRLHICPEGTVIFPKRGGAIATNKKRVLAVPAAFDLNTMGIVPGSGLSSKFLLFWLETIDLATLSDGSNVPQINYGDISVLAINVPTTEEQANTVAEIERRLSMADRLIQSVRRAARISQRLRQRILETAFSGGLVVKRILDEGLSPGTRDYGFPSTGNSELLAHRRLDTAT